MRARWRWVSCAAWAWVWAWAARAAGSLLPLEAERLRASVGGYAVMNCHLDFPFGNEIPYHLQWDKDGETILSWYSGDGDEAGTTRVADRWGGRVRRVAAAAAAGGAGGGGDGAGGAGLGRGSINVTAVRETDAGLYRCRVSFPNRSPPARNNGTFFYLDVDGSNLIVTPPMNVTVLEGERAELECLPKERSATVQWYRDGAPLESLPVGARAEPAPNGSLVLRAATSADPGEYQCRVRDAAGATQQASAFLDVQYKAKVVYSPAERFLAHGQPASLDCHFSANPPLTNLRWEKDGFLFDPYNVPGVFYSRNGSLLFNQVEESHEGEYSCTPYNALGSAGASAGVRVRVARPPALAARPQPLYVARLGDSLTLPCAAAPAAGQPAPRLVWTRKDGSELPAGRHSVSGGNLTIERVAEEDRGVYVCTARAAAAGAAAAAEAELLVENLPPRAPHRLAAHAHARALHLSWAPGHNGMEMEYQVWYRERAESEWRTMKILTRGGTRATLLGLRPATAYELRVLAQDHIGDGLFSKPIFVTTLDPAETEEDAATAAAAAATESALGAGESESESEGEGEGAGGGELDVSVRLLDEGALVRWRRADGDASRCAVRWYEGAPPGDRLLASGHTLHDYMLVSGAEEGLRYWARVECASGAAGGAALWVPQYARLRAVAGGCAAAALLLAAAAAAAVLARRRLRRPAAAGKRAR